MAWRRLLTTTTRGFPLPAARLPAHPPSPRRRPFSAVVDASSDDAHDFLDLNQDPVYVHVCPGSRILELALPSDTATLASVDAVWRSKDDPSLQNPRHHQQRYNVGCNILNVASATAMHARVDALASNDAVSVLFFTSRSPDVFSSGLLPDFELTAPTTARKSAATQLIPQSNDVVRFRTDDDDETVVVTPDAMTAINKLAAAVARVGAPSNTPRGKKSRKHKATVAVYGGRVTATGYSAFAGADYRLATAATAFSLPEVRRGLLPVAGAAYRLATCCPEGVALARYLAVTGRALRADELFSLGLVTHVTEEMPHVALTTALAHSEPSSDDDDDYDSHDNHPSSPAAGAGLGAVVAVEALEPLLDAMHIDCDVDVSGDPYFDQLLLVPFKDTPLDTGSASAAASASDDDADELEALLPVLHACLGPQPADDTPAAAARRLRALQTVWGRALADEVERVAQEQGSDGALTKWFQVTRLAGQPEATAEAIGRMEATANAILLQQQAGK